MTDVSAHLKVADGASTRDLNIEDFKTGRTGAATQDTLAAVLTELGQKLEPSDLAALATAAKQDAAQAVLVALLAAVDGLEATTAAGASQTTLAAVLAKLPTDPSTAGKQDTQTAKLDAIATELGQKLEPADLAALATAAKQDASKTVLDAILTAVQGELTVAVANPTADPETGLAKDATVGHRYAGGKVAKTTTVTAAGDTEILAPSPGQRLRVFWVTALNDPDESTTPLITVGFDGEPDGIYRSYAISHWEIFEGAVDAPLIVNLSDAGSVAVTVHYQEFA